MEAQFQEKHKLMRTDNTRLKQEVQGLKQQALLHQLQVQELQHKAERRKEKARQQREHIVAGQAELEEQHVKYKALRKENRRLRRECARWAAEGGAKEQHDAAAGAARGSMAGAEQQHSKRLRHDESMGEEGERPRKRHCMQQQQEPAASRQAVVEKQAEQVHELERVAELLREEARVLQLKRPSSVGQAAGQRQLVREDALHMGGHCHGKESTCPSHSAVAAHLQVPEVAHGQAAAAMQDEITEGPMQSPRQSVVRASETWRLLKP